jgi:hypothetical protein
MEAMTLTRCASLLACLATTVACGGDEESTEATSAASSTSGAGGNGSGPCQGHPYSATCHTNSTQCSDYYGFDDAQLEAARQTCPGAGTSFDMTPCSTSDSVGGCLLNGPGYCSIVFSYAPFTTPEAQMACTGGEFLPP